MEYALSRRTFVRASAALLAGGAFTARSAAMAAAPTRASDAVPAPGEPAASALAEELLAAMGGRPDADFRYEIVRVETSDAPPPGVTFSAP